MLQSTQPNKLSITTLALIGIITGLAGFALWLYKIQPFYGYVQPIVQGSQNLILPAITDYIQKNPLAVLTAVVSIGAVVGSKLLQLHYERQKAQIQMQVQQALQDNMKLSQAYAQLQQQKQTLEQQVQNLQATDYQSLLAENQAIIMQKTEEIRKLQAQIQALQEMLLLKDTQVVEKTVVK